MVRPLRIKYPGAWYHLTSRWKERKDTFSDDHDEKRFFEVLSEAKNLHGVEMHAYVLKEHRVSSFLTDRLF